MIAAETCLSFKSKNSMGPSNLQITLWKFPSVVKTTGNWGVNKWPWGRLPYKIPIGGGKFTSPETVVTHHKEVNSDVEDPQKEPGVMEEASDWAWGNGSFPGSVTNLLVWFWPWEWLSGLIFSDVSTFTVRDFKSMYMWNHVRQWTTEILLALGLGFVSCEMSGDRAQSAKWSLKA